MRIGHLALEHQHQHVVPGRPRLGGEPVDQQRGRDVVGQVGDHARAFAAEMRARIEPQRIAGNDLKPARIARGDLLQRGNRALVALDGDDAPARRAPAARASGRPGPGPTSTTVAPSSGSAGARDARGQIEIEQEILAEGFLGRQPVPADDVAQRRQVVDLRPLSCACGNAGAVALASLATR